MCVGDEKHGETSAGTDFATHSTWAKVDMIGNSVHLAGCNLGKNGQKQRTSYYFLLSLAKFWNHIKNCAYYSQTDEIFCYGGNCCGDFKEVLPDEKKDNYTSWNLIFRKQLENRSEIFKNQTLLGSLIYRNCLIVQHFRLTYFELKTSFIRSCRHPICCNISKKDNIS